MTLEKALPYFIYASVAFMGLCVILATGCNDCRCYYEHTYYLDNNVTCTELRHQFVGAPGFEGCSDGRIYAYGTPYSYTKEQICTGAC